MQLKKEELPLKKLALNVGQVQGLPRNPRFIRDERFEALKKSIASSQDILQLRPLIVYPHKSSFVVVCGNMRLRAMQELGFESAPVLVLPEEITGSKLREIAIKDNLSFGSDDFDALANEWDMDELNAWGFEMLSSDEEEKEEIKEDDSAEVIEETKISVSVRNEDLDEVLSYLIDRGCQCVVKKKKR